MARRQRLRTMTDRDVIHEFLRSFGNMMTAETQEQMMHHMIRCERIFLELQRRECWGWGNCTCQECMEARSWGSYVEDILNS